MVSEHCNETNEDIISFDTFDDKEENESNVTSPVSNASLSKEGINDDKNESDDESAGSGSRERTSEEDLTDDPLLSDYERLRLRNIRRNEARLAQLGLLISGAYNDTKAESRQSALTSALLITKKRVRTKGYKRRAKSLEPTRSLPRRKAKIQKRFDPSFVRKENVHRSYIRRNVATADGYCSDDSIPASPIQLSKIIKPQSHQKDFHDDKKCYLKQRRNRRGRPKRDEYVYVCDEICEYCGGSWGEILDCKKNEKILELTGESEKKKVVFIDIELMDNDEIKLLRCKDCRKAFHPRCMELNEKKEADQGGCASTVSQKSQPIDDVTPGNACAEAASMEATKDESTVEGMDNKETIRVPISGEAKPITAADIMQINVETVPPHQVITLAHSKQEDVNSNNETSAEANNESSSQHIMSAANSSREMRNPMENNNEAFPSCKTKKSDVDNETVDATVNKTTCGNNACSIKSKDVDNANGIKNDNSQSTRQLQHQNDPFTQDAQMQYKPLRTPLRCYKCTAMQRFGIKQDHDDKTSKNEITAPTVEAIGVIELEAIINDKTVICTVRPVPLLEADISGKTITCDIVLDVKSSDDIKSKRIMGNPLRVVAVRDTKKRKEKTSTLDSYDPITKKIDKIIINARDRMEDAAFQESCILKLQMFADGSASTAALIRTDGLEVLVNAMRNHPKVECIQLESIRTMTAIIRYCGSSGMELVNQRCLDLTASAMEYYRTHAEIQQLGCKFFRALSYDSECCKAMLETNIVIIAMSVIKRYPKDISVLKETSCLIQNLTVVSVDTIDFLLKPKRGEESIVPVLLNAIQENQNCVDFVSATCRLLLNISLSKKGVSKIINAGGGIVLQDLIKMTQALEVVRPSLSILHNLAYGSASLLGELVKIDCASSIIATLRSSPKDHDLCTASFGLLGLLGRADKDTRETISNQKIISMVLDTIQEIKMLNLQVKAFSLLNSIDYTVGNELFIKTAKRILDSMQDYPGDREIQYNGCKILLKLVTAAPKSRALKNLIRTGSGKKCLSLVPNSCRCVRDMLLREL